MINDLKRLLKNTQTQTAHEFVSFQKCIYFSKVSSYRQLKPIHRKKIKIY